MRALLLVVVPLLLAGLAAAQGANDSANTTATPPPGPAALTLTMQAHADGDSYYWTQEGNPAHNPTISIAPGTKVTVNVVDASDQTHNFAVDPDTKGSPYVNAQGDTATYEFTMPDHDVKYYCVPHKSSGMIGTLKAAAAGGAGGDAGAPPPAEPAPTAFTIIAHDEGGSYFWTLEGQSAHNPAITVQPDADITVTVKNSGSSTHNFAVAPDTKGSDYVNTPTDVVTYRFHSGADGQSVRYFCVPHGSLGMQGTIKFAKTLAPPAAAGGGGTSGALGTGNINGGTAELGASDPKCAGLEIPAPAADGEIGGPTLADYQKRCEAGGVSAEGAARAPSGADNVIPISFVLIGLGIVGVVYVHKYYKP